MIDRDKILLMTKMAVYDKNYGETDRAVFAFFRRDYIYKKNMWTRLCVAIGALFLLALYWLQQIFVIGISIQELDVAQSVTDSVLFLLAVMAFYTMVGTIQGTYQYYIIQKRTENYIEMLEEIQLLSSPKKKKRPSPEEDENLDAPLLYKDRIAAERERARPRERAIRERSTPPRRAIPERKRTLR
ncbi:MAG: hypothetical protein FWG65_06675 [Turicibacter sp.]|nr:hypothetical protein [Turicibacter sp.]